MVVLVEDLSESVLVSQVYICRTSIRTYVLNKADSVYA